ncbi:glycosyltransferase [Bacillus sp. DNRA2]|uniref:glycosyltransferase n=1 Tax=Bacillus sp. DNRA2 TaxID=2723053 RepID=UPI00145EB008|nr:glycosyltransferase [Bacillus sp. DNRA2]NMD70861.1 glycosyltransferase [Bacillus sp. DNRA2]
MKKILFVIDRMVMGGTEKILIDIVNHLPVDQYEITVFSLFAGGDLANQFNSGVRHYSWFKKQYKGIYRVIRFFNPAKIYQKYITETYDTEISFKTGMPEKIIAASPNPNSKKIAWIHGDMEHQNFGFESHVTKANQLQCYSQFDEIVTVSEKCKRSFQRVVANFDNVNVVYNGVDINKISQHAEEKFDLVKAQNLIHFVTVVRLHHDKGIDRLILAVEKLVNDGISGFKVWVIGDGDLRTRLQNMIAERNLDEAIVLLGGQVNPYKYLKQSDIFILPSRTEPFGISVIEAMNLGLPVISTKCGGAEEIIGANEFGRLVENNVAGIYDGLKQAIINYELEQEVWVQKSLERGKQFSIQTMIEKVEEALFSTC